MEKDAGLERKSLQMEIRGNEVKDSKLRDVGLRGVYLGKSTPFSNQYRYNSLVVHHPIVYAPISAAKLYVGLVVSLCLSMVE